MTYIGDNMREHKLLWFGHVTRGGEARRTWSGLSKGLELRVGGTGVDPS